MKNNKLMKFIAMFLCIILVVSMFNVIPAYATNDIKYLKVKEKIQTQYAQGILPENILSSLNEEEKQILIDSYSTADSTETFSIQLQDDPEVELIDALAEEYYNFYEQYGYLPDENEINSISSRSAAISTSTIIKQIGYIYTNNQIALHIAQLGILMTLDGALPFLDLVALLVGAAILTIGIAIIYCGIASKVNDAIAVWYYNSIQKLSAANSYTATVVVQSQNGAKWWRAQLVDYMGLGGIFVREPLTDNAARSIVFNNYQSSYDNVYSIYFSDAVALTNGRYVKPEAHRENGRIMNHQHIHAILGVDNSNKDIHGTVHIFFAIPFIV